MIDDLNLTKFTERFYNNHEPVGSIIHEIENLDTKTNDELDTLGKEYCKAIARLLPNFKDIYVDGYSNKVMNSETKQIEDIKYNGLICRFYSGEDRSNWGNFIPDTDIPFDNKAHYNSLQYINDVSNKKDLIKRFHKIVAILENQKNNPKIFEELKIVMHIGQEFECSSGMKEKLSSTITAMESKLQSSIDGLFYTFKDNCINNVLGRMYNDGQSTHYIAGARYMIRNKYGIAQNEQGWRLGIDLSDVLIRLQAYFGMDATIHDAINYVTAEVINKLNSINYDPLANVKISNEPFIKVLGNTEFEVKNLFVINWSDGSYQKNLNFEAIARQQVIQHATNRLRFIKDQEMRVLGMESVFDLIMTASGSKVQGKSYDQTEGWQKIPIEKDFSTLDEILESLELVSSPEHKDEIVKILEKVKIEINSLNGVDRQLKDRQVYKINGCITSLNNLTAQQYATNLTRIELRPARSVIITAYNFSHDKNHFKNKLWDKYNLLVGKDKKEQFDEKAEALYDLFSKINPTFIDSEDLQVTLFDDIKAFILFIAKCVLTVGILPVIEAVEGKSYFISSDRELKTITQEKHRSFSEFVRRNPAALQQQ